jgi:replicative DNA helicase
MTLNSLSSYGSSFQIRVIACLLNDKKFLQTVYDILSDEYFDSPSHKWLIQHTLNYYHEFHTIPSMEYFQVEIKKIENEILKTSLIEQLRECYRSFETAQDKDYIEKEFANFCKNQQLKNALLNSVDLLNSGDYDSIRGLINNALRAGQSRNIGHEYEKDIETRYRNDSRNSIPFPWKAFNDITQGGYGEGDLILIFGNPGGGKSWSIVSMAGLAVQLGYNVVYYSLELGENYVGQRFDAYFTGIPVDQVKNNRKKVEETISNLKGKLIIKEYSPKRASLDTIETHLETLEIKPDVIFIDYLDLLKNRKKRNERKDDIDDVYTDAKGLAKELQIPIVSPSQANRTGAEKEILEGTHIGGSYDKLMIGDIVISLARGRKDKLEGTGRWHFMKNRYGKDGCTFFSPQIDTSTGHINVEEQTMNEDEIFKPKETNQDIEILEKKYLQKKFFELNPTEN